jgi:hypothetical protein
LILGASRRTVATARPSLVFRLCSFQEINDAPATKTDRCYYHDRSKGSVGNIRNIRRGDALSPVFIVGLRPRQTTWLAGFHVETKTTISVVLQAVRPSVLSPPASLAAQLVRLRATGRSDATSGMAGKSWWSQPHTFQAPPARFR